MFVLICPLAILLSPLESPNPSQVTTIAARTFQDHIKGIFQGICTYFVTFKDSYNIDFLKKKIGVFLLHTKKGWFKDDHLKTTLLCHHRCF